MKNKSSFIESSGGVVRQKKLQMLNFTCCCYVLLGLSSGFAFLHKAQAEDVETSKVGVDGLQSLIRRPERQKPEILPCGTTRTLKPYEEVIIESPNFSLKMPYPNSQTCEWKFQFPGRKAKLTCPNFHLAEFLCLDHVDVLGSNGIMNRYCGSKGPKEMIIGESATIKFSSNAFFGHVGFRCLLSDLPDDSDDAPLPVPPTTDCRCGMTFHGTRVVNGIETKVNEFPWQAALVRKGNDGPFCGGSLINDRYVLTAAHCVSERTPYNLDILLSLHNTVADSESPVPYRATIDRIIVHPRYSSRLDYDAALIKLETPVNLKNLSHVCLPESQENKYVNLNTTVLGWGHTKEDGSVSTVLRKGFVTTMSNEECLTKYSSITDRMICAAAPGTDSCQGDSGGPLLYSMEESNYTQIGVVSWGVGCARPNKPGVYTRVSEILRWIRRTASDGTVCNGNPGIQFIATTYNETEAVKHPSQH